MHSINTSGEHHHHLLPNTSGEHHHHLLPNTSGEHHHHLLPNTPGEHHHHLLPNTSGEHHHTLLPNTSLMEPPPPIFPKTSLKQRVPRSLANLHHQVWTAKPKMTDTCTFFASSSPPTMSAPASLASAACASWVGGMWVWSHSRQSGEE